jgi:hypothetical protein
MGAKLAASANAEKKSIENRVDLDTRLNGKHHDNMYHVFSQYFESVATSIAEHFHAQYERTLKEHLTKQLVMKIIVTILLIGSYNTSPWGNKLTIFAW